MTTSYSIHTRPARRAAPSVSLFSKDVLVGLARKTHFVDPALAAAWPQIVGKELSGLSRPGRLSGGARDRTLDVVVPNGAAASRVEFEARAICERVNGLLGPGVVGRIAVRQAGGKPRAKPQKSAQDAERSLNSALGRFRSLVASKRGEEP